MYKRQFYEKPALDENAPAVPEGDFVARRSDMYYVSVDFSGRLGWKSHVLTLSLIHICQILKGKFFLPACVGQILPVQSGWSGLSFNQ